MTGDATREPEARKLSLLVMLLLGLHVLFGITGIIGVLIAHTKRHKTRHTIYYSHLRWQIITFWVALAGYAAVAWASINLNINILWPALLIACFVAFSLLINLLCWLGRRPIGRNVLNE